MRFTLPSLTLAAVSVMALSSQALSASPVPSNTVDQGREPVADLSIVNGMIIPFEDFKPFVEVITLEEGGGEEYQDCGATMIAPNWALTAAHCVSTPNLDNEEEATEMDPSIVKLYHPASRQLVPSSRIIIHPEFRTYKWESDIALVHIDTPLPISSYIPIAQAGLPPITRGYADVYGVGSSRSNPNDAPENDIRYPDRVFRIANAPIRSPNECPASLGSGPNMLCLGYREPQVTLPMPCSNDNGGPITVYGDSPAHQMLIGVIGIPEDEEDMQNCGAYPLNNVSVSRHAGWVAQHVPEVQVRAYSVDPSGNLLPPAATPAPAPGPSASLNCGPVEEAGSTPPANAERGFAWQPTRGKEAGSSVSVLASKLAWPTDHPDYALLAGECAWADALAGTSLTDDAPLLLTNSSALEEEVATELKRLKVRRVIVLGGANAVSEAVVTSLKGLGLGVERLQGASRLETAASIATFVGKGDDEFDQFILARAYPAPGGTPSQAFADSIAVAPYAAINRHPLLLSETQRLSEPSAKAITTMGISNAFLIGGHGALSAQVEQDTLAHPTVTDVVRVAGASRADTAKEMSGLIFGDGEEGGVNSLILLEGQADDAWKVGFTFSALAAEKNAAYGLVSGDVVPPETKVLIEQAKIGKMNIYCLASAAACAAAGVK